ncbi:MAG TPA: inositol monophosphatase family protein [Gemmatimonadaceae bacterium]|nr:inositol monophosphatase family protein [Gemmatimonadaceae bacterium]
MNAPKQVQADITERARALVGAMHRAADAAAQFIAERSVHRETLEWRAKAHQDYVSDVDTGAERIVRETLLAAAPHAQILGEELSPDATVDADIVFVVDPLDGTTNFLHGYPQYAVSIALVIGGTMAAGVVRNVVSHETFAAVLGEGATRNGAPIRVSRIDDPALALVGTGIPFRTPEQLRPYLEQLEAVARGTAGVRRAGSAALDLCDVACGRFEAFWELTLSPWDFAAAALIIREAGGMISQVGGGPLPLARSSVLAGTPAMHAWLDSLLAHTNA